jgi:hypothetical protein
MTDLGRDRSLDRGADISLNEAAQLPGRLVVLVIDNAPMVR